MKEICHNCEIWAELSFYKFLAKEKRLQLKKQVRGERKREREGLWHPQNLGGLNPLIDSNKKAFRFLQKIPPFEFAEIYYIVTYSIIS